MRALFTSGLDITRLILGLQIEAGCSILPHETLILLDEIQEIPAALTSLKYFAEQAPDYHLIASGSLLGIALHREHSFPVGKVDFLHLYPMSFREFLVALEQSLLVSALEGGDWAMVNAFSDTLIEYLRWYYLTGGMPEAVKTFIETKDMERVRTVQKRILESYEYDMSKHVDPALVARIRAVWHSIPAQLAKEQKKFVYGLIRQGARAREYENAIAWLCDAGLVFKVPRVTTPDMPLKAYIDQKAFKLFMVDIGLLGAHAAIPPRVVLEGNALFTEFKGALTEQYAAQELRLAEESVLGYWSADSSTAEIDFIIQQHEAIIPIEVKASENLRAKSLKVYKEKFNPVHAVRTSLSPYRKESWMTNIPLYALRSALIHAQF